MAGKKFDVQTNTIIVPLFRANYVNIDEPRAMQDGGVLQYSLSASWDFPNFSPFAKKRWGALMKEMDRVSVAAFGKPWKDLPGNFKKGIRGNDERENRAGFPEGGFFASLTAGVKYPPGVVVYDREEKKNVPVPRENVGQVVYSGCYCEATVAVYPYDNNGGKGLALGLRNIRKIADGERLDGSASAVEDFAGDEFDGELPEGAMVGDEDMPDF